MSRLAPVSLVGAVIGALLLLWLPPEAFEAIVPVLIAIALALVVFGPALNRWAATQHAESLSPGRWVALVLGILLAGMYGGYFGAAQGVLLIGIMSVLLPLGLQQVNGVKNVLGLIVNLVAALVFLVVQPAQINWAVVGLIAAGSLVGGVVGARVGARDAPVAAAHGHRRDRRRGDRRAAGAVSGAAVSVPTLPPGVTWVESAEDPRVADYLHLTDVALRRLLEPERGLFLAESAKVIDRALAAGHRMRSLLLTPRWVNDLSDLVGRAVTGGIPVYVASPDVVREMTGFHLHRGAIAALHRPVLPTVAEVLAGARRVVVLEDIVDHTNVGAVFRSVAALGVDAVLVTPRCADPLYRRSVRVSMGTVFQVPWTRLERWPAEMADLQGAGWTVAALALSPEAVSLETLAAAPPERLALVLGAEGDGLSERTVALADLSVRIPMSGGVDSLNVAAASAVAMWALR